MVNETSKSPSTIGAWPGVTIYTLWFLLAVWQGRSGFFAVAGGWAMMSRVQWAIVAPLIVFWTLYALWPGFRAYVRSRDLLVLVAIQVIRILALSHLVSWGYGLMAGGFAIPVATGNIIVCVLAVLAVRAVADKRTNWQRMVQVLSIVGLLEFVMTIGLVIFGFFVTATPFDPAVAPGGYVSFKTPPLSLFPTYAIPALTTLHFVTLISLRHQRQAIDSCDK